MQPHNLPLFSFLQTNDLISYLFSFISIYNPILRLVCKDWSKYFKSIQLNENLIEEIIKSNELNVLKWLYSKMNNILLLFLIKNVCAISARNGNLDCLKWARENGCVLNKFTCHNAAMYGHLDCLKWARENSCDWNVYTCSFAAFYGHLDCLKYARENGCPWNERTCSTAAYNGHFDCLKWARENGCDWDKFTCSNAAENGHLDCLNYAKEDGCPE